MIYIKGDLSREIYPRDARMFQFCMSISVLHHVSKVKYKNHKIISIEAGKSFDKKLYIHS